LAFNHDRCRYYLTFAMQSKWGNCSTFNLILIKFFGLLGEVEGSITAKREQTQHSAHKQPNYDVH